MARTDTQTLRITADVNQAIAAIDRLNGRLEGLEGAGRGVQRMASQVSIAFRSFAAFIAVDTVLDFAKGLQDTAIAMERLDAQLVTATGSQAAAESALADISELAQQVPADVDELAQAFVRLTNLGLDPSVESLEAYGNVAAAMGKSIEQFSEAVADAVVGEFERLKEFGIRSSAQGEEVEFTFRGITTTVANSAEAIEGYLRGLGEVEFADALRSQMDGVTGSTARLENAFLGLSRTVADAVAPAMQWVIGLAADAVERLDMVVRKVSDGQAELEKNTQALKDYIDLQKEYAEFAETITAPGYQIDEVDIESVQAYAAELEELRRSALGAGAASTQQTDAINDSARSTDEATDSTSRLSRSQRDLASNTARAFSITTDLADAFDEAARAQARIDREISSFTGGLSGINVSIRRTAQALRDEIDAESRPVWEKFWDGLGDEGQRSAQGVASNFVNIFSRAIQTGDIGSALSSALSVGLGALGTSFGGGIGGALGVGLAGIVNNLVGSLFGGGGGTDEYSIRFKVDFGDFSATAGPDAGPYQGFVRAIREIDDAIADLVGPSGVPALVDALRGWNDIQRRMDEGTFDMQEAFDAIRIRFQYIFTEAFPDYLDELENAVDLVDIGAIIDEISKRYQAIDGVAKLFGVSMEDAARKLDSVRQSGEEYAETLARVTEAHQSANSALQDMERTAIAQADFQRQIRDLLGETGWRKYINAREEFEELERTGGSPENQLAAISRAIAGLAQDLQETADRINAASAIRTQEINERYDQEIADAVEHYDALRAETKEYYDSERASRQAYYDAESERQKEYFDSLREATQEYYDNERDKLRDSFDERKEAAQAYYDYLRDAASVFFDDLRDAARIVYENELEQIQQKLDQLDAQREIVNQMERLASLFRQSAQAAQGLLESLTYSDQSPLSATQRLDAINAEISGLNAQRDQLLAAGDQEGAANITQRLVELLQERLGLAEEVFQRGSFEYAEFFNATIDRLEELSSEDSASAEALESEVERQTAALDAIEEEFRRQMSLLRDELADELDQIDQREDERLEELNRREDERLEELNRREDERLEELNRREDERLKEINQEEDRRADELRDWFDREIDSLNERENARLSWLNAQEDERIERAERHREHMLDLENKEREKQLKKAQDLYNSRLVNLAEQGNRVYERQLQEQERIVNETRRQVGLSSQQLEELRRIKELLETTARGYNSVGLAAQELRYG